jgi:hypothetical protein
MAESSAILVDDVCHEQSVCQRALSVPYLLLILFAHRALELCHVVKPDFSGQISGRTI